MPIPDFQSLMLPIMKIAERWRRAYRSRALREKIAKDLRLSDDELKQLLPSGQQPLFTNRLAWARAHLRMAGLVERTGRGTFRITPRGQEVVTNNPPAINMRFLHQFPEYAAARHKPKLETAPESSDRDTQTPQEQLEAAYETLRANLAKDILTELKAATPDFFEKVVIEVLVRMGYGSTRKDAGQAIGKSGDEGIDGFIKEDRFGTGHYLHPSKALAEHGQPAGDSEICRSTPRPTCEESITTSDFSKDGIDYAAKIENKIVLIDGEQLAEHMIDFGVGVTSVANYEVKQIDSDYFATEGT